MEPKKKWTNKELEKIFIPDEVFLAALKAGIAKQQREAEEAKKLKNHPRCP